MCMGRYEAIQKDDSDDSDDACVIPYLTNEMKQDIWELPSLSSVADWTKNLGGMLVEFHLHKYVDIFSLRKGQSI